MTSAEHVAVVVDGLDLDAGVAEKVGRIAASGAPEFFVDDSCAQPGDRLQVDKFGEPLEESGLDVGGFEAAVGWRAAGDFPSVATICPIEDSICFATLGRAGAPSWVENLMPLYSGGLWEAVRLMVAPSSMSTNASAPVEHRRSHGLTGGMQTTPVRC